MRQLTLSCATASNRRVTKNVLRAHEHVADEYIANEYVGGEHGALADCSTELGAPSQGVTRAWNLGGSKSNSGHAVRRHARA